MCVVGGAGGGKGGFFLPSLPSPHFLPSPSPFSPPLLSPLFSPFSHSHLFLPISPSLPPLPPPCTPRLTEGQFVDHACTVRPKLYCIKQEQIYVLFPPVSPVFSLLPFSPLPSHFSLPSAPPPPPAPHVL